MPGSSFRGEPMLEEPALGVARHERERTSICALGLIVATCPVQEVSLCCVKEVMASEGAEGVERIDEVESRGRLVRHRCRSCAVLLDVGRRHEPERAYIADQSVSDALSDALRAIAGEVATAAVADTRSTGEIAF